MTNEPIDNEDEATELAYGTLPLVQKITVRGLHGRVDYDLDLSTIEADGNVALLYGDNGTGKTTILRLLWDLLSPAPKKGHRTRISKVAFSQFSVHLSDLTEIRAVRKVPSTGPYVIELFRGGELEDKSNWPEAGPYEEFLENLPPTEWSFRLEMNDPEIVQAAEQARAKRTYLERLKSFGSSPYFLADTRTTSSDEVEDEVVYYDANRRVRVAQNDSERSRKFSNPLALELEQTMRAVTAKFRRITLGGSVQGSAGANSVYMDVIGRLADTSDLGEDASTTRKDLIDRVERIGKRNSAFADLDLVSGFATKQFVKNLRAVKQENLGSVRSIVDPFLQSLSARLDALEDARLLIQTLLDEANKYLLDKRLTYRRRVLRVELADESQLKTDQLSSGECHVLLLLLNAVLAGGAARLFIIDEPELSLNVKWQRRIVSSLLSLTDGTGLQFVLATHSIELLSGYRDRVVRLSPVRND